MRLWSFPTDFPTKKKHFINRLFTGLISLYQTFLSPLKPARCRFYPSCSEYAKQAISHWGVLKGIKVAVIRLFKCHPYHPGGYDPVKKSEG